MMVNTIYGEIDDRELRRKAWVESDQLKATAIVEYYLADKLVHRSAHVTLKQGIGIESLLGAM
jgi:hypothetical protein